MPKRSHNNRYTHRRAEAARGSVRLGHCVPTAHFTQSLPALVLLRKPLSGLVNLRIPSTLCEIPTQNYRRIDENMEN